MKTYFRIFRDQFHRLTLLNFVYFVLTLPLMFVFYVCVNAAFGVSAGEAVADILPGLGFYMTLFSAGSRAGHILVLASIIVSALLYGPLKYLYCCTLRAFFCGEYRFFSDVFAQLRGRLIQSMLIGLADLLIFGQLFGNLTGAPIFMALPANGAMRLLIRAFSLIALLFWIQLRRYLFVMEASAKLSFGALIKNSAILSVVELGHSGKSLCVSILVWGITFLTLPLVTVILLPVCAYSVNLLSEVCILYPEIERRVLKDKPDDS